MDAARSTVQHAGIGMAEPIPIPDRAERFQQSAAPLSWRDVLVWGTGSVGALYLAGYLALVGYVKAYDVLYFPALIDQQFLVLGANCLGVLLFFAFLTGGGALALVPAFHWLLAILARIAFFARMRAKRTRLAAPAAVCELWGAAFATLMLASRRSVPIDWLALVEASFVLNALLLRWVWARGTPRWLSAVAATSVATQALALPILFGMTAIGPCRMYAEVRRDGSVVAQGGLLSRTPNEVVLLNETRGTLIVALGPQDSVLLDGMFNAKTRVREPCGNGAAGARVCCR